MSSSAYVPYKVPDRILTEIQQRISDWSQSVSSSVSGGVLISKVTFPKANTDVTVVHGLGNAVGVNYFPSLLSAGGTIYLSPNASPSPQNSIILRANVAGLVANLWFFNAA